MELEFNVKHKYRWAEERESEDRAVFKAQDLVMNRDVAMKKVKVHGESKKEVGENFKKALQEVKTMVQIAERTPGIPNVYEYWWDESENFYLIMQWIEGESLAEKMRTGFSAVKFLSYMITLCEILREMDKRNFHHKDIKPQNIMFDSKDNLYLIDFGITVSAPNMYEGTRFYKAPEMDFDSVTVSRDKADMFSIGVILYQFFAHELPVREVNYYVEGPSDQTWTYFKEPKDINPDIIEDVNTLIRRAMAYRPKDRYENYGEIIRDLRKAQKEIKNANRS